MKPKEEGPEHGRQTALPTADSGNEPRSHDGPDDGPIPQEVLDKLPGPMREQISQTIGLFSAGPIQNPISKKITSDHITKLIENDEKDSERGYKYQQTGRIYTLVYVVISIAAFFGLAYLFAKSDPELLRQILAFFATFAAGFGAGWGFTTAKASSKD